MPASELKPCPICGDEAEIERHGTPRQSAIVRCTMCGCGYEGPDVSGWNVRAHPRGAGEKMTAGFELISLGITEGHSDLLHFAVVYDHVENWCGPVVHTFQDLEMLKAVLRRCLERIESGEHEAHRLAVERS